MAIRLPPLHFPSRVRFTPPDGRRRGRCPHRPALLYVFLRRFAFDAVENGFDDSAFSVFRSRISYVSGRSRPSPTGAMLALGVAAGRYRVVSCAMAATHPVGANCVRPPLRHCVGTGAASGKAISTDIPSQSPAVTALPEGEPRGLHSSRRMRPAGTPVFPKRANAPSCANRTPKAWLSLWESCRRSRLRG